MHIVIYAVLSIVCFCVDAPYYDLLGWLFFANAVLYQIILITEPLPLD